jgi:signal transduction histidine kinase
MCERIMHENGGDISISSVFGEGTVVSLVLPVRPSPGPGSSAP